MWKGLLSRLASGVVADTRLVCGSMRTSPASTREPSGVGLSSSVRTQTAPSPTTSWLRTPDEPAAEPAADGSRTLATRALGRSTRHTHLTEGSSRATVIAVRGAPTARAERRRRRSCRSCWRWIRSRIDSTSNRPGSPAARTDGTRSTITPSPHSQYRTGGSSHSETIQGVSPAGSWAAGQLSNVCPVRAQLRIPATRVAR
jgi:hypothetical protein